MALTFIMAAVVGLGIGVLSGMLGIGGGTIMVPMFRLAFGLSAVASTATSLFTIIPTSVSGVVAHVRNKTCIPKLGIAMGLGGACTSPLGVWLANQSPSWAVMLAAVVVIGYSAFTMVQKALRAPKAGSGAAGEGAGAPSAAAAASPSPSSSPSPSDGPDITRKQLGLGFCIGLIAGVASGYVGLGGGFLMVPLMLSWIGLPMKRTSGTSLIGIMLLAIPGAVTQGLLGNIDYLVGIATAIGSIPGAMVGARLVTRVPERTLRLMFSVFLGVGAVMLVVKELGALG